MTVADLSHGGLKLEGPQQLSTGDTLEVSMELDVPVQVVGEPSWLTRRTNGYWVAHVSFLENQRESIDMVDSYVALQLRGLP